MKYILNETPLKTTNNFKINNIEIDLDVPSSLDELNFDTNSYDPDKIKITNSLENNFNSKIGLNLEKYHKLNIDVVDTVLDPLIINFDLNKSLIDELNINVSDNSNIDLIIKYMSNSNVFHCLKNIVNLGKNSKCSITIINLLNSKSTSLIAVETKLLEESILNYNLIDLGGNIKTSNYYSELIGKKSINNFNSIYLGLNNDRIDMNYWIKNIGESTKSNILVEGSLSDNAFKSFKGTIDFIEGCKKSIGSELENCVLLSDTSKSKSLPMLLCHEEDVIGSHGVSTGKIDNEKLFYLMSKGLSEKDAIKLIVKANFNKIISNISDEKIVEEISDYIDNKLN